jgi:hypothetical protein
MYRVELLVQRAELNISASSCLFRPGIRTDPPVVAPNTIRVVSDCGRARLVLGTTIAPARRLTAKSLEKFGRYRYIEVESGRVLSANVSRLGNRNGDAQRSCQF